MAFNEFEVLEDLMSSIKPIDVEGIEFAPVFDYGSNEDLNKFLRLKRRGNENTYPLIWLETPYSSDFLDINHRGYDTKLILATNSSQSTLNKDRMKTTFKLVLLPLLDALFEAIKRHGKVSRSKKYGLTYHFNYSVSEKESTDIWDVLVLDIELKYKIC